ncbi:MAG: hypothetical protein C4339_03475 [Nitrososphaerota archaeon]
MSGQGGMLERILALVLTLGVTFSLALSAIGVAFYYVRPSPQPGPSDWRITGTDYFSFAARLLASLPSGLGAYNLMALGLVLLLATPYVRVLTSFVYFALTRDGRYSVLTLAVLTILTWSLFVH